jgi:hypothetical protein
MFASDWHPLFPLPERQRGEESFRTVTPDKVRLPLFLYDRSNFWNCASSKNNFLQPNQITDLSVIFIDNIGNDVG